MSILDQAIENYLRDFDEMLATAPNHDSAIQDRFMQLASESHLDETEWGVMLFHLHSVLAYRANAVRPNKYGLAPDAFNVASSFPAEHAQAIGSLVLQLMEAGASYEEATAALRCAVDAFLAGGQV